MKQEIYSALLKQFEAGVAKHAMNARIMLENPTAIHDHTDFMTAIESELAQVAEYQDKIEALNYVILNGSTNFE